MHIHTPCYVTAKVDSGQAKSDVVDRVSPQRGWHVMDFDMVKSQLVIWKHTPCRQLTIGLWQEQECALFD